MKPRVLVVEDEAAIRLALTGLLGREGYEVHPAVSGADALEKLLGDPFDLVLTDLALGAGPSGMDVLRATKQNRPETPVVMITAHGSEKIAVEAIKSGAEDYVPKPFDNDEIRVVLRRALERTRLERENRELRERIDREWRFESLIGSGAGMRRVFDTIRKVAETDLTVLIRGESGTGKELVAQALHQRSPRRTRPFLAVNCAAISRELVESELFGHEKGAFTGADARRVGRFEAARGGTIFLDEIGDMPSATQAKVLRVLQERTFERVGGNQPVEVDVRVVAATHRDLEQEVRRGRFREDLYYRLKVVEIELPALRERPEDVPALVEHFLAALATRLERKKLPVTPAALARLTRHAWPGNVRELRNVVEQAAVLASGPAVDEEDLRLDDRVRTGDTEGRASGSAGEGSFSDAKRRAVERFERSFLLASLRAHEGNVSRTAAAIGMVRQSLQQKIRELGLRDELREEMSPDDPVD
ncbi:sigma-54 dependent transcriptional regulator [Myxococcota bacterium]|nr:sigma-54 dependent transcriptional regulator [Myxococcota bacterium]MCZ7618201.1 sigma-54 dependent transcriptional regulator [Myxococcota bacterium]